MTVPSAGSRIAGYRLEHTLGHGGMGVVYLAIQLSLDRRVALKVIRPELANEERFRERFFQESRLAASIDHPNVLPVHEAGEADGHLFLASRYVQGSDLGKLIRREGRLSPERTADLVSQVAAGLDAAHDSGLVHRDVKPANILVSRTSTGEHAYLADFGLVKRGASSVGLTREGLWVGTLDYVAPEQIKGDAVDRRADVYSLGCLLFEALTGRVPYPRETDVATLWAHLADEVPRPAALAGTLSASWDDVIRRAMAKAPDERYASAGDLGAAALALVEHRPHEGIRPDPPARPRRAQAASAAGRGREGGDLGPRRTARVRLAAGAMVALVLTALVLSASRESTGRFLVADVTQVGRGPSSIIADRGDVWVSSSQGDTVTRLDLRSGRLVGDPVAVPDPEQVALGAGAIWVSSIAPRRPGLFRIDPRSRSPRAIRIKGGGQPFSVAVGEGAVWTLDLADGERLVPLGLRSFRRLAEPLVLSRPRGTVVPGRVAVGAGAVWVSRPEEGTVVRINPKHPGRIDKTIRVGREPVALAVGAGYVWVVNQGDGTVGRVDPRLNDVTGRPTPVEGLPSAVAVDGHSVWVVSSTTPGQLVRLDARSARIVGKPITVGRGPNGVAARDGYVWVANTGDHTVSRVEPRLSWR